MLSWKLSVLVITRVGGVLVKDQVTIAPPSPSEVTVAEVICTPFISSSTLLKSTVVSRRTIEAYVPSGIEETLVEEPGMGEARATIGRKVPGSATGAKVM